MKVAFVLGLGLLAFGWGWVRFAPSDPARWHVAPSTAAPGPGRFVVRPEGGDGALPARPEAPQALLERLDAIALATPRTVRLAGTPAEGRITYVTRSRMIGFPDYTTVAATSGPEGTVLSVFARLRFGRDDLGVNRARVEAWIAALTL